VNLTPLDIRKQSFQRTLRGFDPDEVQAFLEMAAEEFERLTRENIEMKEQHSTLKTEVERYRKLEQTLQEMLRTAQETADEVRQNARKEGGLIIRESEVRANSAVEDARIQVREIRSEIVDLKNQRDLFVAKIQALVTAQSDFLDSLELSDPDAISELVEEGRRPEG
jgi:cell division initiation protein